MKSRCLVLLLLGSLLSGAPLLGEDDFLTSAEIDRVREAQDPNKRIVLYLDLAQLRIDEARTNLASKKPEAGQKVQKNLEEYTGILESLDTTLLSARDKRVPVTKALQDFEKRGAGFLKYLESLESDSAADRSDYEFTLEEAIDTTREELAEVKKGSFPEVQERKPPVEFPARPPAPSKRGDDEGPPRKKRSGS
jgi:hypothetical protein